MNSTPIPPTGDLAPNAALRKAAILLASLDAETAAKAMQALAPEERRAVAQALLSLDQIDPEEQRQVLEEYGRHRANSEHMGGVEFVGALAEFQSPRGGANPASPGDGVFGFLLHVPLDQAAAVLNDEPPQTAALALAHLPPTSAAALLEHLDAEHLAQVLECMVELDAAEPDVLETVAEELQRRLAESPALASPGAGLHTVAEILKAAGPLGEQHLLRNLARHDRPLASQLGKLRSGRPDLESLDDDALSVVVAGTDPETAIRALSGFPAAQVERLLSRLPPGESRLLRHALQHLGPIHPTEAATARSELLSLAERLALEGRLPG